MHNTKIDSSIFCKRNYNKFLLIFIIVIKFIFSKKKSLKIKKKFNFTLY